MNTQYKKAFKLMEKLGWNIEDFEEIYRHHLEVMENTICEEEETEFTHLSQFMLDFLNSLDHILRKLDHAFSEFCDKFEN